MSQVPAATKALQVLRYMARQPEPVTLESICAALGIPRSSGYHLMGAMVEEGFVVHLAEDHRYGLGVAAFEVGSGYTRQEPLARIARRPLQALVDRTGQSAHLAVPHGREVLYIVEERAPRQPSLVTDVGVRLPAHLTATGRAILAALPASQVRALFPDRSAFVERHGAGPGSLSALQAVLAETRQRGYALEAGEVTPGFSSVAVAVLDHNDLPVAGVAVTWESAAGLEPAALADEVGRAASSLSHRLTGGLRAGPGGPGRGRRALTTGAPAAREAILDRWSSTSPAASSSGADQPPSPSSPSRTRSRPTSATWRPGPPTAGA